MLQVKNRDLLREQSALVPLIEQIALCVSSGSPVRRVSAQDGAERESPGWVVFQNDEGEGIGVNLSGFVPSATVLRRRLTHVLNAQKLARCFGGAQKMPLYLSIHDECPEEWRIFRTEVRAGSFLCASSFPTPPLEFRGIHATRAPAKMSLRVAGWVPWSGDFVEGATARVSRIDVEIVGQRIAAKLFVSEGGFMNVQRDESQESLVESEGSALVRVDIGEIELSLAELMALRAGSVIELDVESPMKCFLRLGATTLAEGELSIADQTVSLTLTTVVA